MTQLTNKIIDGNLWLRCPFCGDSKHNQRKAHFSIRLIDGAYFCHRCGEGGFYKPHEFLTMTGMDLMTSTPVLAKTATSFYEEIIQHRQPGPGSPRKSKLSRWHFNVPGKGLVDVFESRTLKGSLSGVHLRPTWEKKHRTYGNRLFGFAKEKLFTPYPVRIVEGPYDVVTESDVCLFGLPSRKQVKALGGFKVILCPDGDVWESENLLSRFCRRFHPIYGVIVVGVEKLPKDKDPDEVPPEDREIISYKETLEILRVMEEVNEW